MISEAQPCKADKPPGKPPEKRHKGKRAFAFYLTGDGKIETVQEGLNPIERLALLSYARAFADREINATLPPLSPRQE